MRLCYLCLSFTGTSVSENIPGAESHFACMSTAQHTVYVLEIDEELLLRMKMARSRSSVGEGRMGALVQWKLTLGSWTSNATFPSPVTTWYRTEMTVGGTEVIMSLDLCRDLVRHLVCQASLGDVPHY
ncbi:hypothetical protein J6590_070957 [Homalodisca vitripennis]|nr:hypothetical protein J6590_070957 [Homalodisca vitripennis]